MGCRFGGPTKEEVAAASFCLFFSAMPRSCGTRKKLAVSDPVGPLGRPLHLGKAHYFTEASAEDPMVATTSCEARAWDRSRLGQAFR